MFIIFKVYDTERAESFKSTDIVTFVGILSTEPSVAPFSLSYGCINLLIHRCDIDHAQESSSDVPTLHVLFTKFHAPGVVSRPFPRVVRRILPEHVVSVVDESPAPVAQDTTQVRTELIDWIAEEALGGDKEAAEWVLYSCIARV